mgnify:CR=1 FL=1
MNNPLKNLYNTNTEFKRYVDAWCKQTGDNLDTVLSYCTVKEYALYLKEQGHA